MNELKANCSIYLQMEDGETKGEAIERLRWLLDGELCNLADHRVSYQIHSTYKICCP